MMHSLALEIDHANSKAGWMKCYLTIDGQRHLLHGSAVFPPFVPLLRFVKAVAGQRFPARYFFDEEGMGASFEATAVAGNSDLVHLKISHSDNDPEEGQEENTVWLDAAIERETVIQAFLPPVVDMSQNFLLAEKEWYLPGQIVTSIQSAIANGLPLRSDIHSPQRVECSVQGSYDVEYLEGCVFFHINFDDENIVSILLFDTNPFWGELMEFMGNIAGGNLPCACEHVRVVKWNLPSGADPLEFRTETRFVAESLAIPQNFRLKIFTRELDEAEEAFLLLDEVVDRRQFTTGCVESFRLFLEKEYQAVPDGDGKTFDLRTLLPGKPGQVNHG